MGFKEVDIKSLEMNPFSAIGDQWMLITAGNEEGCNAMTASWGGLGVLWAKNVATIYVRPQRYTKEFIDSNETFSLSFLSEEHKKSHGVFGSKSGRDLDKFEATGLNLDFDGRTPLVKEAELVLICRKLYCDVIKPEHFMDDSIQEHYLLKDYHAMYIAEIEKVLVK